MNTAYKIGQILIANHDTTVEMALSGDTKIVRKGSKVIIGADKFAHHFNGCIQPISKDAIVEGYDATGLAEWIVHWLNIEIPYIAEALEDYDVGMLEIQYEIENALEDIGFTNTARTSE